MQKTLIASVLIMGLGLSATSIAGNHGKSSHDRGERHIERMTEQLDLSSAQQEQLRSIHQEQRAAYRALHEETREQVADVLTDEQLEKMQAMREERREKMQQRYQKRADGGERFERRQYNQDS